MTLIDCKGSTASHFDVIAVLLLPFNVVCVGIHCSISCCAVLRCAVLCCAVLCCAVLCCAVLCNQATTRKFAQPAPAHIVADYNQHLVCIAVALPLLLYMSS